MANLKHHHKLPPHAQRYLVTGILTKMCIRDSITDSQLNLLAEGPVLAIHQNDVVLAAMDDWNRKQHGASGLVARVRASLSLIHI